MAVVGWRGDLKGCSGGGKNAGPIANGSTSEEKNSAAFRAEECKKTVKFIPHLPEIAGKALRH